MIRDILSTKRRKKRATGKDDFDRAVDGIEAFAPRQYRPHREAYYYNYKMMAQYLPPLLDLLLTVARTGPSKQVENTQIRHLCLKVKDFYDLKDKLTVEEALRNPGYLRKCCDVFLFFFNNDRVSAQEVRQAFLEGSAQD